MGALEMVQQNYPSLAWLVNDPEIGPLLLQAVDPNSGFDANTFQAKIQQTNWFRSRSKQGRENEVLAHTDPQTLNDASRAYGAELSQLGAEMGAVFTADQVRFLTAAGMNGGWSADSQIMRDAIAAMVDPRAAAMGQGTSGAAKHQIESLARGQWFAPVGNNLGEWGISVAAGKDTLESINARYASQAWNMYPHLRQQITEGQTLADIINPYRQIVAEELEMGNLEQVDMNNPEWRQLLQWRDPASGEIRLPTASEAQTMARNRPQWWQTSKGRQADAGATRSMLQIFGGIK